MVDEIIRRGNSCPNCDSSYLWKFKRGKKFHCYECDHIFTNPKKRDFREPLPKKRDPRGLPMITRSQLLSIINRCENKRNAAFLAAIYLTGARVSELIKIRADQFEEEMVDGKQFLVIRNVITLKKRKGKKEYRPIYVPYETEREFCDVLLDYINLLWEREEPFPFTRQWADDIIKQETQGKFIDKELKKGLFCHYFRHMRGTDMLNMYHGFKVEDLMVYFGWEDLRPAGVYVHRAGRDVARRLAKGID